MSAAPLDDRINARAQLEHVARGLYADPTSALRAMRHDAHAQGADEVRRRLEDDFTHYGEPAPHVHGPARERAQLALREGSVAADVGRWLTLDHTPAGPQLARDGEIERVMQAPDAEALGRAPADPRWPLPGEDPRAGLNAEERLAYDQIEAFAEAKERADRRQAAEARLHEIADHRDNLAAAEANIPRAKAALKSEVEGVFADGSKAMEGIEAALERDGPAEGAAGDPARAEVGADAGRAAGAAFRVERAPGGWAVVHAPAARRWTLAREETARRFAEAGNIAAAPGRLARVLRGLDRETARESHRDLVARSAASELLDQAALHCFVDPVAATDVVRWNHLRRQPERVRMELQAGPAPFGEMRVEREAPEVWARLSEPRHAHVPAWARFRAAAEVWLDVQEGRPWTPPAEFPPPPAAPVPPRGPAWTAAPQPQPRPARPLPPLPDELPLPFARERSPGLSR